MLVQVKHESEIFTYFSLSTSADCQSWGLTFIVTFADGSMLHSSPYSTDDATTPSSKYQVLFAAAAAVATASFTFHWALSI